MQFSELELMPQILRAVEEYGYHKPSPIQKKAIPPVISGRDLLGCAQTGTGKTAAFALPIVQRLAQNQPAGLPKAKRAVRPIRALVLTPTRELALQIQENFEMYAKYLPLRSTVIFGGVGQGPQVQQLKRGIDILVATPGRLNDLIGQGYVKLDSLEVFVLDEADRMLDMGFVHDVKKILAKIPKNRQTLLFSATMPAEITKLADSILNDPVKIFVTPASTTVKSINQSLYKLEKADKKRLLPYLLKGKEVTSALVFTRTKHGADRVVKELGRAGINAMAIHGGKGQTARQNALESFKKGRINVLIATDIAARGIDINELSHVFNYDLPNIPETYVHRIGRTGRAGRAGVSISFCSPDEDEYLKDIEKLIGFEIPKVQNHPWARTGGSNVTEDKTESTAQNSGEKTINKQKINNNKVKIMEEKQKRQPKGAEGQKKSKNNPVNKDNAGAARNSAAQGKNNPAGKKEYRKRGGQGKGKPRPQENPYENRTGGGAIITKKPVWGAPEPETGGQPQNVNKAASRNNAPAKQGAGKQTAESEQQQGRSSSNNNRRRKSKPRGGQNPAGNANKNDAKKEKHKQSLPEIPKDDKGLFDFSEAELAADKSMRIISTNNGETKYANFEDFLKDH